MLTKIGYYQFTVSSFGFPVLTSHPLKNYKLEARNWKLFQQLIHIPVIVNLSFCFQHAHVFSILQEF